MRKGIATAFAVLLATGMPALADQSVDAKQIVQQGNGKGATACVACHGMEGAGNPDAGYPRLSILNDEYLAGQLHAFKDGKRTNPVMQPIAKALSDAEIKAVSKYYAEQTASVKAPAVKDESALKQGEALALRGDWNDTIPACESCHGPGANGVGTVFPALAGQHASYIKSQIEAWQKGQRTGDPNELMHTVAKRLNEQQISAVAAYLASLTPGQ